MSKSSRTVKAVDLALLCTALLLLLLGILFYLSTPNLAGGLLLVLNMIGAGIVLFIRSKFKNSVRRR